MTQEISEELEESTGRVESGGVGKSGGFEGSLQRLVQGKANVETVERGIGRCQKKKNQNCFECNEGLGTDGGGIGNGVE